MPNIIIDRDKVIIEGIVVYRPSRIAPSQWLRFWELVQLVDLKTK
jgi:hypothetical protein